MLLIGEKEVCFPPNGHKQKKIFVECDCDHHDHYIEFCWFRNTKGNSPIDGGEMYVQVGMCKLPFWRRVKYGLKYIFGHISDYGAPYDTTLLMEEDVGKLIEQLKIAYKDIQDENKLLMESIDRATGQTEK